MVSFVTILASAALLSSRALAVPLPDSSINEPGVRAPNGTPITDGAPQPTPNNNYNNNYMSTSTVMMGDTTTSTMMGDKNTKTMMGDTTSTMMEEMTTTTMGSYTTSTMYGSGYNNWNGGYNNCVQQCMNSYGAPPAMYTPPPSTTTTDSGNGGGGSTITVIVAPSQGVKRYVPFAVNASAGDTILFHWNASPHTVTKSSILTPCNKTSDNPFTSGVQNASFEFPLLINDTNTVPIYCGVPGHCQAGMFGFINPPNADPSSTTTTSVAALMPAMIANSTDFATQVMYVANMTAGTTAENWGNNFDLSQIPAENHMGFMQNVLQTRLLYAMNEGMLEAGLGATSTDGSPIKLPADISQITASTNPSNTGTTTTSAPAGVAATASSSSSAATSTGTGSPSGSTKTGAAMGKNVASSAAVGLAVLVAFLAL